MKSRLLTLNRIYKEIITLSFDIVILIFSLWLSFALRLVGTWNSYLNENLWIFILIPIVATPLFIKLGLYRSVLQYTGIKVITTSFKITISCFVITFFMYFFQEDDLPRSIMPIFWFVSNTFIITSRFLLKGFMYSWDSQVNKRKQIIVYGLGLRVQIVESLKKSIDYAR